jgi:hypothetical protein
VAYHSPVAWTLRIFLLTLVVWIGSIAAVISVETHLLEQRGSAAYLIELTGILAAYAASIIVESKLEDERWQASRRAAVRFGFLSGCLEVLNVGLENATPHFVRHASISICFMLVPFLMWGAAAFSAAESATWWQEGLLAAIESAGICMLLAVASGFVVELVFIPPGPQVVATWREYDRSGWSNARLFAIANTFESGTMHLLLAPFVACFFGCLALITKRAFSREQT